MKTSEFIAALAADPVQEPIRIGRRVAVALVAGLAASVALYWLLLGPRPDVAAAAGTLRFWLKFVDSFAFALPTLLLTLRLARPDAKPRALALWLLAPFILLAAGVVVELLVVPQSEWMSRLMGTTALHCTVTIPMLAAPILAGLIVALRAGAPLHPSLTGAIAGAASAGVAALVYGSSCPGDSPLFVATWYPLATLICIGVGALAGRRFLAW
ncbi:MAG: NrsF family protein [Roseiarcus sp.]